MQQDKKTQRQSIMNNLQRFLDVYGNYVSQNHTVNMDIDDVLTDISSNIFQPSSDRKQISKLYQKGYDLMMKLKSLKQQKLYQTIVFIQQLNHKLNREYEQEVKKGIANGIYDKNDKNIMK